MRRIRIVLALLLLAAIVLAGQSVNGNTRAQACLEPPWGMAAWWPGDGSTEDIAGENDGILQGGATYAGGMVEEAFSLSDVADYVSVPNDASLNPVDALTVDAWIRPAAYTGTFDPVVKKSAGASGYALEFGSGDDIAFWVYLQDDDGWENWMHSPAGSIPLGTWTHVAGVYDGQFVRLYVNGQEVGPGTEVAGSIVPSDSALHIGHDPSNSYRWYHGLIDEVEVFGRALDAEEISAIYEAGSAGKCKSDVLQVGLDILPGKYPNCLKINGHGSVEVAILGSETFDVTQIEIPSLVFAGLDVRLKGNGASQCSVEDVSGDFASPQGAPDGYADLVCRFADDGDWTPDNGTATVTGNLYDGTAFEGSDEFCLR